MENRDFQPGDFVMHFKRETLDDPGLKYLYKIIGKAHHTETGEELMVYWSLETGKLCARPLEMFMSEVDYEKYPNIRQKYRFEKIDFGDCVELARALLKIFKEESDG